MKKILLTLSAAALVLASCAKIETVKVDENRAISFSSFTEHSTKSVTELSGDLNASDIYVIGYYGTTGGTSLLTDGIFFNELGNTPYYWEDGNDYIFAAYANGRGGKIDNATFTDNSTLTFDSYAPADDNDLVVAISEKITNVTASTQGEVSLTMKHMLAQVGFTFKTEVGDGYTLKIEHIRIENAIQTAKGTYNKTDGVIWAGTATGESVASYEYSDIADLVKVANKTNQEFKLVIPQSVENTIKVKFTATINGVGIEEGGNNTKNFEVVLPAPAETEKQWKPGYRYNYTTTINGENISEDNNPILFTVTADGWSDYGGQDLVF